MKNSFVRTLLHLLVFVLVLLPAGIAYAKEISSITVTGPGISGELIIQEHKEMMSLLDSGFIDHVGYISEPAEKLGTPYTIHVSLDLDGNIVPFVQMDYYPLLDGQPGYVHYTGQYDGKSSIVKADNWSRMALPAEKAFVELLAARGIEVQSALAGMALEPAMAAPAASASAAIGALPQSQMLAIGATVLLMIAAGLLLRRRALRQASSR